MHRTAVMVACVALLLGAGAEHVQAQMGGYGGDAAAGLRAGYDYTGKALVLGLQTRTYGPLISVAPSVDVYFLRGRRAYQVNLDAQLSYDPLGVYGGAGLAVGNRNPLDSITRTDWSLYAGLHLPMHLHIRPFAEARWSFLGSGHDFQMVGGLELTTGFGR